MSYISRKVLGSDPSYTETRTQAEEDGVISTPHVQLPYNGLFDSPNTPFYSSCTTLVEPTPSSNYLLCKVSSWLQGWHEKLLHVHFERRKDNTNTDSDSINTVGSKYHSLSHGCQVYYSSGRGGAGNIHRAQNSCASAHHNCDTISIPRGREPSFAVSATYSTGRGGAGNIRRPSGSTATDLVEGGTGLSDTKLFYTSRVSRSFGRGGAGNVIP